MLRELDNLVNFYFVINVNKNLSLYIITNAICQLYL